MTSAETSLAVARSVLLRRTGAIALAWALTLVAAVALLLAFADRPPIVRDANLVANDGFETGVAPWRVYGRGLLERSTVVARTGNASGRMEANDFEEYGMQVWGGVVRPRPGDVYAFSVWLKGEGAAVGNEVTVQMNEHGGVLEDETDRWIAGVDRVVRREWTQVRVVGRVIGDGRDSVDLFVIADDARRIGETVYVDDLTLVKLQAGREPSE
jgi:hypothetical protein